MTIRPVQAIVTKYFGPSNVKGSRIKATAKSGSITLHRDHSLNIEDDHAKAAKALADKFGWRGGWFMGDSPDGSGYCFVCTDEAPTFKTIDQ
jgi:hypothetical protein